MNDELGRDRESEEIVAGEKTDLKKRTKAFALRIVRLYTALPKTTVAQVLGKQVLRSGTSVGAHYREASRARSTAEFISKLEVAIQELDETLYWLDLLQEAAIVRPGQLTDLRAEAEELISIFVSSVRTAKHSR
ncbi:MAG: four helix bundle protein [Anaerolineae bacterium]